MYSEKKESSQRNLSLLLPDLSDENMSLDNTEEFYILGHRSAGITEKIYAMFL